MSIFDEIDQDVEGSTGIIVPSARNSRHSLSSAKLPNKNSTLLPPRRSAAELSRPAV
jgi:hypothetical protein